MNVLAVNVHSAREFRLAPAVKSHGLFNLRPEAVVENHAVHPFIVTNDTQSFKSLNYSVFLGIGFTTKTVIDPPMMVS